jgi:hypothetical protein
MLTIKFQDNLHFPSHKDIHVKYEELHIDTWVDSYYLALDQHLLPRIETFEKARMVQKHIFKNWQLMVQNLNENESLILPYDISDQYIGFLYVQQINFYLYISKGWTEKYYGYSFTPSFDKYLEFDLSDLRLDSVKDTVLKNDFIEVLRNLETAI